MSQWRGVGLWLAVAAAVGFAVLLAGLLVWRDDILEALLDPKIPYAVYRPPPPPDYRQAGAWALLPGPAGPGDPSANVFFIHPTTFDGGRDWNGPIGDRRAAAVLSREMIPNYAAPFATSGRVFAPRYRQASLYTSLTMFDDAIEARQFAYDDIRAAFHNWLSRIGSDGPIVLVGVEQGGFLGARLISEEVARSPALRRRLAVAYLIDTVAPDDRRDDNTALPGCAAPTQVGCLVAWISAPRLDFIRAERIRRRSLVWRAGRLTALDNRPILCVNPLLGIQSDIDAPARLNRGAANATGLEWGARPGLMARQVGAQCVGGILRVGRARSDLLRPPSDWSQRLRSPSYNLFWADLEADAARRLTTWRGPGFNRPR